MPYKTFRCVILLLLFAINPRLIYSRNLQTGHRNDINIRNNSIIHSPLELEIENQYYGNKLNSLNPIDAGSFKNCNLDTSNIFEENSKRRLLPEDMSWMENFLWGENGIFRSGDLTRQKRKSELVLRRDMLTWHQRLGITTWFLMTATVLAGQITLNGDRQFRRWHSPLAEATIIGYSATGLLAILAPPPLVRRAGEHDTVFWHKLLAWVHAAGMIALPILANNIVHRSRYNGIRGPEQFNQARARAHQIAAYITYSAFTASIITIFF